VKDKNTWTWITTAAIYIIVYAVLFALLWPVLMLAQVLYLLGLVGVPAGCSLAVGILRQVRSRRVGRRR